MITMEGHVSEIKCLIYIIPEYLKLIYVIVNCKFREYLVEKVTPEIVLWMLFVEIAYICMA